MLFQALCIISKPSVNSNWVTVWKPSTLGKIDNFLSRVTLKYDGWPWKIVEHLFSATSNFLHSVAISEFKLELWSRNAQIGAKFVLTSATLTFCMDIISVNGNYPWKFHDDMMTGIVWKSCHRQTQVHRNPGKSEGFDSYDRPSNLTQTGFKMSIFQPVLPWNVMDDLEQGKSEGFDSCNQPSNLA